jgi:hypothetical protein
MTKSFPLTPPAAFVTASKKGGIGKTFLMATVADLMTVNGYPYSVFQADDKKRLGSLIGAKVVDLWPNPDLVMGDPALVRKAFTPLYTACSETVARGKSVLFDIGADEVEDAANFLTDVEIDEDLAAWGHPMIISVLVLIENLLEPGPLEASGRPGPRGTSLHRDHRASCDPITASRS